MAFFSILSKVLLCIRESLENTLILGKIEGRRRKGRQRMRWLDGITNSRDMTLGKLQEMVRGRKAQRAADHEVAVGHDLATEQQQKCVRTPRYKKRVIIQY